MDADTLIRAPSEYQLDMINMMLQLDSTISDFPDLHFSGDIANTNSPHNFIPYMAQNLKTPIGELSPENRNSKSVSPELNFSGGSANPNANSPSNFTILPPIRRNPNGDLSPENRDSIPESPELNFSGKIANPNTKSPSNFTILRNPNGELSPKNRDSNPNTNSPSNFINPNGELSPENRGSSPAAAMEGMREMIFRVAAMQPIQIDPETVKPRRRKNVKISKDPQSVAARHRRERISERIRILQRLVPGGTKMDTASMLDEAVHYVKFLKKQVQSLERAGVHRPVDFGFSGIGATMANWNWNMNLNLNYPLMVKACQPAPMAGSVRILG